MTAPVKRTPASPFSEHIEAFLAAKTLAPKSKLDYGRYLREFDEFTGHGSLKKTLTLDNATQWIAAVTPRGVYAGRNAALYLKSMASWIAKTRTMRNSGGGSVLTGLDAPQTPKSRRQAFTDAQLKTIWARLAKRPNRDRIRAIAYVKLLLATGLRRNEARQLALANINLEPGRAYVHVEAHTAKGSKERFTRIDRDAIAPIEEYLKVRPEYVPNEGDIAEPLFLTESGMGFTENGFGSWAGRIAKDIFKATGIRWKSHLMRHTWATNYHRGMKHTGNTVYDMMWEGGWADPHIPLTYTHQRPLDELLDMKTPASALRDQKAQVAS
jgi:integrase